MSDLSRLLDDVYGDSATDDAPPSLPPARAPLAGLPDWAVESVLDEAFADWVPGPPVAAGGEAAHADDVTDPGATIPRSAFSDVANPSEAVPEAPHAWSRGDDDILPTGRRRGGRKPRDDRPTDPTPPAPIEAFAAPEQAAPEKGKRRLGRRKG